MTTTFSAKDMNSYNIMVGDEVRCKRISSTVGSNMERLDPPRSGSTAFVIMDGEPDSKTKEQMPYVMQFNSLRDRPLRAVAAGAGRVCVVTEDNCFLTASTVVNEDREEDVSFSLISSLDTVDVFDVACGADHTIVIGCQGSQVVVLGMGNNTAGQLGLGKIDYSTSFRQIKCPGNPRFLQARCGWTFTTLLTHTGELWVFGQNTHGQLGIGKMCDSVREPRLCKSLKGIPICAVACGSSHTLVLSATGAIYAAGNNEQGQLGFADKKDYPSFTLVQKFGDVFMVQVAAFGCYSAAIDEYGTLYVWGGKYGADAKSIVINPREKFVDVSVGADGRLAALTRQNKLIVVGFYVNGDLVLTPACFQCTEHPLCRVYGGGEYFVVLGQNGKELPLSSAKYDAGRSLLPPPPSKIRHRLRPPRRVLALSGGHFPDFMMIPAAQQIARVIFSSLGSLNASFLVDNFSESLSAVSSGTDIQGLINAYNFFAQDPDLMATVTNTFNRLLVDIQDEPPEIRRPVNMRFLVIAAFHPSPMVLRAGFNFWRNFMHVLDLLNMYTMLSQWFTVISEEHLRRILQSFKDFLTLQANESASLYAPIIVKTVKAIGTIYSAATRSKRLAFDEFYHDVINEKIDILVEYEFWERSETSWCFARYAPWLLNADTKTRFLQQNARKMMSKLQMDVMRNASQFVGDAPVVSPADLYLIVEVDRHHLIVDAYNALSKLKNPDLELKKPLKILFTGEPGVDEGGVQREFFELIIKELFDAEHGLFTNNNDVYWFNSAATDNRSLQRFHLVGALFGLAIYNGNMLNVRFPLVVYKKLRGLNLSVHDLKDLDPQLFSSLESLMSYDGDVENDMCLTFEFNGVPLCPGGSEKFVTNGNREEYVNAVTDYVLNQSIDSQFSAFKVGFLQAAGDICMDLFRPEELALLVAGREELDFIALQKATRYEGYTDQSETVRTFWKIVHTRLTDTEKRRLLYFVTASPRAPINGLGSVPFVIAKDGDPHRLPTSHTCFFMLVLPDDPDEESLYNKIKLAIDNCEGFGFK